MPKGRGQQPQSQEGTPPEPPAGTPTAARPMLDHSFTLQAIMDLKGTVASLATKVDRLIDDTSKHGDKIDAIRQQISFVKGALWVIGGLMTLAITGFFIYLHFIER